jgi:hypothetical protein
MSHARILSVAAIALGVCAPFAANAEVAAPNALSAQAFPQSVVKAQYYGGYYRGYGGDEGVLDIPGDVLVGAGGLVGGLLGDDGYYGGYYAGGGIAACERAFRSFDPASGTYMTYSGERVMCPTFLAERGASLSRRLRQSTPVPM